MQSVVYGMLTEIAAQLFQKTWDALTNSCLLGPVRVAIQPYMCFNPAVIHFQILSQRANKLVTLKQIETLFESGTLLPGPDGVDIISSDRSL